MRDFAAEGLDGGPVDDPLGGGQAPPALRSEPAQEGLRADVDADQAQHRAGRAGDGGQVEVGGPDDLDAVDVDQLVVEHVAGQEHLALPPAEVAVEARGAQLDGPGADGEHIVDRHERRAPADLDHEAGDRRVGLLAVPAGDDVGEPPDLSGLIEHGRAHQAGEGDEAVADRARGDDALAPVGSAPNGWERRFWTNGGP